LKAKPEEKIVNPSEEMSLNEIVQLAIQTLGSVLSSELKSSEIEVGIVSSKSPDFKVLSEDEIDAYLTSISEKD
jgi:20S proteasome subunit alpha 1